MYHTELFLKEIRRVYYSEFQKIVNINFNESFELTLTKIINKVNEYPKLIKLQKLYEDIVNNTYTSVFGFSLNMKIQNMEEIMRYVIRNNLDEISLEVINLLKQSDRSCIVGGFIRDTVIGEDSKDIDFVTDLNYDYLYKLFKENNFKVNEVGKKFKVLSISKTYLDEDKMEYITKTFEISNFRKDGIYDGRRPNISDIGTIVEDANRRDFTVNALYYNLKEQKILDVTGQGAIDLYNKTLRYIGDAYIRIQEDYLRIYRFYRLMKKFNPVKKDLKTTRRLFYLTKEIDSNRLREELEKMI